MNPTAPKDTTEQYLTGNVVTGAFQTSGIYEKGSTTPTNGQADAFSVITTKSKIDEQALGDFMDKLGNATLQYQTASTGASVAISQGATSNDGKTFNIVSGGRGDSQIYLIKQDAAGKVTIDAPLQNIPKERYSPLAEYGEGATPGDNNLISQTVSVKPGEKLFVVSATDGVTDAYLGAPGVMAQEVAAYLKANPGARDLSRFIAERAVARGSLDNTTVIATQLDSRTELGGRTIVNTTFDGLGKGVGKGNVPEDFNLTASAALTQKLKETAPSQLPDGQRAMTISSKQIKNIGLRPDDLQRAGTPDARDPNVAQVNKALRTVQTSNLLRQAMPEAAQPAAPALKSQGVSLARPAAPAVKAGK